MGRRLRQPWGHDRSGTNNKTKNADGSVTEMAHDGSTKTSSSDGRRIETYDAVATKANGTDDNDIREDMLAHRRTQGSGIYCLPTSPTRSKTSGDYTGTSDSECDPSDMDRRNEAYSPVSSDEGGTTDCVPGVNCKQDPEPSTHQGDSSDGNGGPNHVAPAELSQDIPSDGSGGSSRVTSARVTKEIPNDGSGGSSRSPTSPRRNPCMEPDFKIPNGTDDGTGKCYPERGYCPTRNMFSPWYQEPEGSPDYSTNQTWGGRENERLVETGKSDTGNFSSLSQKKTRATVTGTSPVAQWGIATIKRGTCSEGSGNGRKVSRAGPIG